MGIPKARLKWIKA
ncbi:unnamed protein product, partial [Didymodactylos carnosus]